MQVADELLVCGCARCVLKWKHVEVESRSVARSGATSGKSWGVRRIKILKFLKYEREYSRIHKEYTIKNI